MVEEGIVPPEQEQEGESIEEETGRLFKKFKPAHAPAKK
jgi:hypothetical protein